MTNEWIDRKDQEPDPKLYNEILVISTTCGKMHVAFREYDCWTHTEACYESGHHFTGDDIEFRYWMPLPEVKSINEKMRND